MTSKSALLTDEDRRLLQDYASQKKIERYSRTTAEVFGAAPASQKSMSRILKEVQQKTKTMVVRDPRKRILKQLATSLGVNAKALCVAMDKRSIGNVNLEPLPSWGCKTWVLSLNKKNDAVRAYISKAIR